MSGRSAAFHNGGAWWFVLLAVSVGLATAAIWQTPQRINHDCALYLQEAELLLEGAVPYCDFVETNPPLIIYLNLAPVLAARTFGVSSIVAFQWLILAIALVTGLEIYALLRLPRSGVRRWQARLVLAVLTATYFLVDWQGDTGQREHLFMLLYGPYFFLRVLRHRGGSTSSWFAGLLGVQAGLGVALKPHFLLAAVVVEVVLLLGTRRWRSLTDVENGALAAILFVYATHWLFVPTAMREAFFGHWMPLLWHGYHAYNVGCADSIRTLLNRPFSLVALAAVPFAVWVAVYSSHRFRTYLLGIVSLACMALVLVIVQKKGWSYHHIPLESAGLLCAAFLTTMLGDTLQRRTGPRNRAILWAGAVFWVALLAIWSWQRVSTADEEPAAFAALRQSVETRTKPHDAVLVVATSVRPAYPMLLQIGRRPGSRYLCSFPIALLYAGATPQPDGGLYRERRTAPVEEQRFLAELQEDVRRVRPRLIVIQDSDLWQGLPVGFNMYDYLWHAGWCRLALEGYQEVPSPAGWKILEKET